MKKEIAATHIVFGITWYLNPRRYAIVSIWLNTEKTKNNNNNNNNSLLGLKHWSHDPY